MQVGAGTAEAVDQRLLGLDVAARHCLGRAVLRQRRGSEDPPGMPGAGEQHTQIPRVGQVVRADRRPVERIARPRHDRAAAVRPGDAHHERHARLALEPADPVRVVAPRCEQQLQIRALQPLAAAAEHHRGGDAEGQGTPPSDIPSDLADQPDAARHLIDRDLVLDAMGHADGEVIGEVGADPRQVVRHRNPDRLQLGGRPDTRDL